MSFMITIHQLDKCSLSYTQIPATHAGIHAGRILSLEHKLHVNFTLVCDLNQAAACLRAEPYGISVPIKAVRIEFTPNIHIANNHGDF